MELDLTVSTKTPSLSARTFVALQAAAGLCFIGHGMWGLTQKRSWLDFYEPFGVPDNLALLSMPVIGSLDILVGITVLLRPTKAALAYMSFWAVFTALLRPFVGLGWWEFLERAGNYGPPMALLLVGLASYPGSTGPFRRVARTEFQPDLVRKLVFVLRVSVALLLVGHGGYGLFQGKPMLLAHLASVGIGDGSVASLPWLHLQGGIEIGLGLVVALFPLRATTASIFTCLLWCVLGWKIATELLYPIANPGMDVFEFIERSGNYFAPLALIFLVQVGADLASAQKSASVTCQH